jgi:2-polyprenyl-6-methoxyphenol hydroxylase-like FAD-dependent oxidoreductase
MTDVVIAGGGIAGSALAILLGRAGFIVEIFERGKFPKEKPCGEGLMPAGVAVLERLGVSDTVGGTPFYGVRYHAGDLVAAGRFPNTAGVPAVGLGQRRRHLDHALFAAAAATPNVRAHTGTRVEAPLLEQGRVNGLLVEGEPRRAKLVVAADGVHSHLRQSLGLDTPPRRKRFGVRAHFRLALGQAQPPWVDVFLGRGHELYVTPLPGGEILVAGLADARPLGAPIEQAFRRWRLAEAELAARLDGAEQVSELQCISPLSGRARAGVAPGAVLLGDAAGFLDPITGGGMSQALMSAELLAEFLCESPERLDDWLAAFDRQRRVMLRDYAALTQAVLWLADRQMLLRGALRLLRNFPGLFSHFIGVAGGVRRLTGFSAVRRRQANRKQTPRLSIERNAPLRNSPPA